MNESNIRKYAELMRELGLTGLEITEDNKVVRLERMSSAAKTETMTIPVKSDSIENSVPDTNDYIDVISPMVGMFYPAPAENAEPFVQVGSHVKKGDVLCIIEAMKLMNEVVAEQDGTIMEICVPKGCIVEYGTVLFRMGE